MTSTRLRWLIRRDLPAVVAVSGHSRRSARSEEEFLDCLRRRDCIGLVAESEDDLQGYMLYRRLPDRLQLLDLAVAPAVRRQGVGTVMVDRLKQKLSNQSLEAIVVCVRETELGSQLFLQACGFWATKVIRDYFDDPREDAYRLEFRLKNQADELDSPSRVAQHLDS